MTKDNTDEESTIVENIILLSTASKDGNCTSTDWHQSNTKMLQTILLPTMSCQHDKNRTQNVSKNTRNRNYPIQKVHPVLILWFEYYYEVSENCQSSWDCSLHLAVMARMELWTSWTRADNLEHSIL